MNKLYDIPMSYTSVLGGLVVAPTFVAPILVHIEVIVDTFKVFVFVQVK
jgi:hypothetical protein